MVVRHPAERGKGRFERFSESASNVTSSPVFYAFCLLLVAFFVATHVAGLAVSQQLLAGDLMTCVTLLLLALLKNSERRAERAIQRKLDAIAAALLEQSEGEAREAQKDLRRAIRMEEDL
ncbi:low affinity iron permease family protein [Streptomyces sp. HUAS TT20]|uniref:low affinity iron permease family protein n=1 Tax=Streptomyces sp. HUAS TT20 TaxID=3447509 RepID=UPI0021D891CB|nr:low affinity iron permease family protein [Streptomyces sp. HUAS 15-9]UXY32415.1 low affinity iron permease family protein [Streptomyces sp. HUAS 15-9]